MQNKVGMNPVGKVNNRILSSSPISFGETKKAVKFDLNCFFSVGAHGLEPRTLCL
jgi:hypothetical protein